MVGVLVWVSNKKIMQKICFKKLNKKSGIYCIFNKVSLKTYIGSSKNIYDRLHQHLHKLKRNAHVNKHLQSSFNKYGEDKYIYVILEFCKSEERFIREQYYINLFKPEYNKSLNVKGNLGIKLSEENKKQISNSLKNYILKIK